MTRLAVVGQGYAGLPIAMRAVTAGFSVVGLDLDAVRIFSLRDGKSYLHNVADAELSLALSTGRYLPTVSYEDVEEFDVAIITVPTTVRNSRSDLNPVASATEGIAPYVRPGATVVLESVSYPGTTEEVVVPLLEKGSGLTAGRDFAVGYSPVRAEPGDPKWNFVNTPKLVSGVDAGSLAAVKALYDALVETTVPVATTRVAELARLLENAFRHVNLALINEIAMFAHQVGVDVWAAVEAAATKPFEFLGFLPGPGIGSRCLPVDPGLLPWRSRQDQHHDFRFVSLANEINEQMPDYVVRRVVEALEARRKVLPGSVVLLLGLSGTANTGDLRGSPSLRVAELLSEQGAVIRAVDSYVESRRCPPELKLVQLDASRLRQADVVVLLTDHDDVDYELVERESALVLDTRHRTRGSRVEYL